MARAPIDPRARVAVTLGEIPSPPQSEADLFGNGDRAWRPVAAGACIASAPKGYGDLARLRPRSRS